MGSVQSRPNVGDRQQDVPLSSAAMFRAAPVIGSFPDSPFGSHYNNTTLCEDAPPPPPLPPSTSGTEPPAPPPAAEKAADSIEAAARAVSSFPNPGPYDNAMGSCGKGDVTLDTFDGFRCDISKQIAPHMAVFHSFWMGTNMLPEGKKSTYNFMAQVFDERGLLMARVDPGRGTIDGRIHRTILGVLPGKLQIGVGTEGGPSDQLLAEVDFGGETWTGNLKYGSMGGGLMYGLNYFQSITPKLAMGGEGMYISANSSLLSSYTARYLFDARVDGQIDGRIGDDDSSENVGETPGELKKDLPGASALCVNFNTGQAALTMNYRRCVTPGRVTLAAELQCNPFSLESQILLGAKFKLQRSQLSFCLDGTGRIQSVVEARLGMAPGSPMIKFSADGNHFTDEMRFGFGIDING